MSTAAPLQSTAAKSPSVSKASHAGLLLQRKCACGGPASLTGECEECNSKRLQKKLSIGASNDPLEQEADRVADQVLSAPAHSAVTGTPPRIQRFTGHSSGQADTVPASVDRVLAGSGRPLDPALQQDMGQRFGHDFSRVRVHTGSVAEQSALDVNADAYTVGYNVVFGRGSFAPGTSEGRRLIAHELTHVVQQSGSDGSLLSQNPENYSFAHSSLQRQITYSGNNSILRRQVKRGAAAGCGICMNDPRGNIAGGIAHAEIQAAFTASNPDIVGEHPIPVVEEGKTAPFIPEVDLSYETFKHDQKIMNIGEIKPLDDADEQVGIARKKLQDYARELMANPELKYDEVFRMRDAPPANPLPFFNPSNPPGCPPQLIYVQLTEPGIYQYHCEPPWSTLVKDKRCACKKGDDEQKKKEVLEKPMEKPEQTQENEKKSPPQQKLKDKGVQKDDDSVLPIVAVGVGAAATAAAAAYLRKRAIKEAELRAAQLAWRKLAEAAAAKKAAQAAGKSVAGKTVGKAAAYVQIAAGVAAFIFYSNRVEAKPGPGASAIEALYKAMAANGPPPSPEMKALIESDPLLKQLAEDAAGSGDGSKLQEEMARRTLELIRDNPGAFTPEDLDFLTEYSKTAKAASQSPETADQLRKAIDAAKAGKTGGEGKGSGAGKAEDKPSDDKDTAERVKLVDEIKADTKLKQLYDKIFTKKGNPDLEVLRRLAALKARLDDHPDLLAKVLGKIEKGEMTDPIKDLIEPIEAELDAVEKKIEPKPTEEVNPGSPSTTTQPPEKKDNKPVATEAPKVEPSDEEKATATRMEFWSAVGDASFKKWTLDPGEEASSTPTLEGKLPVNLTLGKGKEARLYNFWAHGTLIKKHDVARSGFQWSGDYDFAAPSGIIKSTQGDKPIYFADAGKTKTITWGLLVKPNSGKKKK